MFDEAMKVMNKKLTKSNYPVNIFLLLIHNSLQRFLLSSSLLFLSVKRGFKFICNEKMITYQLQSRLVAPPLIRGVLPNNIFIKYLRRSLSLVEL